MKNEIEQIICSAIWFKPKVDDGLVYQNQPTNITEGFVTCGVRHSDCFKILSNKYPNVSEWKDYYQAEQGFITSENRFVDRENAYDIAIKNGQFKYREDRPRLKYLFSEDLW